MKIRYELHIGSVVITDNLNSLKRISENTDRPWEIYKYIIPTTTSHGNMKLTQDDIDLAIAMKEENQTYAQIARKFHISISWACDTIRAEIKRKLKHSHT